MNASAYTVFQTCTWQLADQAVSVVTKPGQADWDHLTAAESLAALEVQLPAGARVALFNGRRGALAACLARTYPDAFLTCLEPSWLGVTCTRRTLQANQIQNALVLTEPELPASLAGQLDAAVILIPKGRELARRWLRECQMALKPGGELYIAGAKDAGIESVIKDAEQLFGESGVLSYKKGERVVKLNAPPSSPSPAASLPPPPDNTYDYTQHGLNLRLTSLPGVFSAGSLDEGTALLLEHLPVLLRSLTSQSQIIDAGCGCGVIGLAAASLAPSATVTLVDADLLAVASARRNITLNQIHNAQVQPGDLLADLAIGKNAGGPGVHLILSNPPFHTGKETNYAITEALIEQAYSALLPGGRLALVANRFLPYQKNLVERFGRVKILSQTSKFQVLCAER